MPADIAYPEPTEATVKKLYGTAFQCAELICKRPLYRVHAEAGELILNSRVAHIQARRSGGPRFIEMDSEANRGFENLLLLCLEHHEEVDTKALEHVYPADLLREWKSIN